LLLAASASQSQYIAGEGGRGNGSPAPPDPALGFRSQVDALGLLRSPAGPAARAVTTGGPRDGVGVQRRFRRGQEAAVQAAVREGELHVHLPPRRRRRPRQARRGESIQRFIVWVGLVQSFRLFWLLELDWHCWLG